MKLRPKCYVTTQLCVPDSFLVWSRGLKPHFMKDTVMLAKILILVRKSLKNLPLKEQRFAVMAPYKAKNCWVSMCLCKETEARIIKEHKAMHEILKSHLFPYIKRDLIWIPYKEKFYFWKYADLKMRLNRHIFWFPKHPHAHNSVCQRENYLPQVQNA